MFTYLRKPGVYIPLILLVIVFSVILFSGGSDTDASNEAFTVRLDDLEQIVSVTGRVVPVQEAKLSFERSGKVASVAAEVGAEVSAGQIIVQLENADAYASLLQAQANEKAAEAQLEEVKRGSRAEDIAISEARLASSKQALLDAKQSLVGVMRTAYTVADDAIRNKTDQFFSNPQSRTPTLIFSISNFQLKTDIETQRFAMTDTLVAWKDLLDSVAISDSGLVVLAGRSVDYAKLVKAYLDRMASAVNSLTANASLSQTVLDSYKASVATSRTSNNSALDGLTSALTGVNSAESNVSVVERELELKRAAATPEAISAAEARVEESRAQVKNADAQFGKTVLRSPFTGVVTAQSATVGEIVSANAPLVSLMSKGRYEIEVNVPEADIAKISVGDMATATLDAYGSDINFPAEVKSIDPAETLVDNVATYKVTLLFTQVDARIKSGMTANLDIVTERLQNIVVVPVRAVQTKSEGKYVRILAKDSLPPEERLVTVGIRGTDGTVEILSGLTVGEQVLIGQTK